MKIHPHLGIFFVVRWFSRRIHGDFYPHEIPIDPHFAECRAARSSEEIATWSGIRFENGGGHWGGDGRKSIPEKRPHDNVQLDIATAAAFGIVALAL